MRDVVYVAKRNGREKSTLAETIGCGEYTVALKKVSEAPNIFLSDKKKAMRVKI